MRRIIDLPLQDDAGRGANVRRGEWAAVPDTTIQYQALSGDTGETNGGHWYGRTQTGQGDRLDLATYCAILPPNPTAISGPAFALRERRIQPVP
jgi:hypothetical protein